MNQSRRGFLQTAGLVTVGFGGLRLASADPTAVSAMIATGGLGHGPLIPDPKGVLDLPAGFAYAIIARQGATMSDGFIVPSRPDGMAAFPGRNGTTVVVCNHELNPAHSADGPFGKDFSLLGKLASESIYDMGGGRPAGGGTTSIVYDTRSGKVLEHRLSLAGTLRNCAGGPTPWNSWITCEEIVLDEGDDVGGMKIQKAHGYNFEVPAWLGRGLAAPVPLKAMGRFNHEAVAVDPHSGIVYQTEDVGDGLIYRFLPDQPGALAKGGRLQALAVKGQKSLDTRNWESATVAVGEAMEVEWIEMDNVEAPEDDLRLRGFAAGAARFARGEGMWYGRDAVYFACTNGGARKKGQVWRYIPSSDEGLSGESSNPGKLELFVEPNDGKIVDNADNLTIAPWGDVLVVEDGAGPDQFLLGITPAGKVYRLGRNAISDSEMAGPCFSPDGSTLFVNIQGDGLTLAITGPWQPGKDAMRG